jgi:DNA-binding YbaB/EbfC family protein
MFNFQKMMKQAQEMQFKLQEVQEKLKDIDVSAEAGAGLVKITMNCGGKVKVLQIDPSLMNGDKETLEDIVVAAVNNVTEVKDERIKLETRKMMEAMGLPGDMGGLPM